jgi:hypothetical protein
LTSVNVASRQGAILSFGSIGFSPMAQFRQRGASRRLDVAVVWLAALLFGAAPAVSAVCALDAYGAGDGRAAVHGTGLADGTGHDEDSCCPAMSAPVIESSKPFGGFSTPSPAVGPSLVPALGVTVFAVPLARLPTPPPEPVSHRFLRLLI